MTNSFKKYNNYITWFNTFHLAFQYLDVRMMVNDKLMILCHKLGMSTKSIWSRIVELLCSKQPMGSGWFWKLSNNGSVHLVTTRWSLWPWPNWLLAFVLQLATWITWKGIHCSEIYFPLSSFNPIDQIINVKVTGSSALLVGEENWFCNAQSPYFPCDWNSSFVLNFSNATVDNRQNRSISSKINVYWYWQ